MCQCQVGLEPKARRLCRRAIAAVERCLHLKPAHAELHLYAAALYFLAHNMPRARRHLDLVHASLQPVHSEALTERVPPVRRWAWAGQHCGDDASHARASSARSQAHGVPASIAPHDTVAAAPQLKAEASAVLPALRRPQAPAQAAACHASSSSSGSDWEHHRLRKTAQHRPLPTVLGADDRAPPASLLQTQARASSAPKQRRSKRRRQRHARLLEPHSYRPASPQVLQAMQALSDAKQQGRAERQAQRQRAASESVLFQRPVWPGPNPHRHIASSTAPARRASWPATQQDEGTETHLRSSRVGRTASGGRRLTLSPALAMDTPLFDQAAVETVQLLRTKVMLLTSSLA